MELRDPLGLIFDGLMGSQVGRCRALNTPVYRVNKREGDMNLGLAEEFRSSVIKASEGKTGVHLVDISMKEI